MNVDARWAGLDRELAGCELCPRLVEHRERTAREKRKAYLDQEYWGRPVPGFGDRRASLVIVGLAPAAHGANRTGRMFTGDRSGDWLYRALFEAGYASQPGSTHRGDGLELEGAFVTAANRCAPPANKPTPAERDHCRRYLERELELIDGVGAGVEVIVALGQFAFDQMLRLLRDRGAEIPVPRPRFAHAAEVPVAPSGSGRDRFPRRPLLLIGSYHPSQQNTFTGKLTREMLGAVFDRAREVQSEPGTRP